MTQKQSNWNRVKDEINGRWSTVLSDLYPDLADAAARPGKKRIVCPVHGSTKGAKGDGFRFYKDLDETGGGVCNTCGSFPTGIDLIKWLDNCSSHEALAKLENYMGWETEQSSTPRRRKLPPRKAPPPAPEEDPVQVRKWKDRMQSIWKGSTPLSDLPPDHQAIRYLRDTRGIGSEAFIRSQTFVRFNPQVFYQNQEGENQQWLPALVSMFHSSEKKAIGLHRTYLHAREPRTADVEDKKKVLRLLEVKLNGGISLFGSAPHSHHINVCEGIETGLSIVAGTGRSVIACTTAQLVESWTPLPGTKAVTIWADLDRVSENTGHAAGEFHSFNLRDRLTELGIRSRIIFPSEDAYPDPGVDWNDVLKQHGPDAISAVYQGNSPLADYA